MAPKATPGLPSSGFMRSGVLRSGYWEDNRFQRRGESDEGQPIYCESSTSSDELAADCDVPRPSIEPESGSLKRKRTRDVTAENTDDEAVTSSLQAREDALRTEEQDASHRGPDRQIIVGDESPSGPQSQLHQDRTSPPASTEFSKYQAERDVPPSSLNQDTTMLCPDTVRRNSPPEQCIRRAETMAEAMAVLDAFSQNDDGSRVTYQERFTYRRKSSGIKQLSQHKEWLPEISKTHHNEEPKPFKIPKTQHRTDEEIAWELHDELNQGLLNRADDNHSNRMLARQTFIAEQSQDKNAQLSATVDPQTFWVDRDSSVEIISKTKGVEGCVKGTKTSATHSKDVNEAAVTPSKHGFRESSSDGLFISPQITTNSRKRILNRAHGMFSSVPAKTGQIQKRDSSLFGSGERINRPIFNKPAQYEKTTVDRGSPLVAKKERIRAERIKAERTSLPTSGSYESSMFSASMKSTERRASGDGKPRSSSGFRMLNNPSYAISRRLANEESPLQRMSEKVNSGNLARRASGTPELIRGAGEYLKGAESNREREEVNFQGMQGSALASNAPGQYAIHSTSTTRLVAGLRPLNSTNSISVRSIWEVAPGEEVKLSKAVEVKIEPSQKAETKLSRVVEIIDLSD